MTDDTNRNLRLDAALLEMATEMRGSLLREQTADRIAARVACQAPKPNGKGQAE